METVKEMLERMQGMNRQARYYYGELSDYSTPSEFRKEVESDVKCAERFVQWWKDLGNVLYYQEKLIQKAEIQDIIYELDQIDLLQKAKEIIDAYTMEEFQEHADFSDLEKIGVAYTTTEMEGLEVQVYIDLIHYRVIQKVGSVEKSNVQYKSLQDLITKELELLSFDDLVYVDEEEA